MMGADSLKSASGILTMVPKWGIRLCLSQGNGFLSCCTTGALTRGVRPQQQLSIAVKRPKMNISTPSLQPLYPKRTAARPGRRRLRCGPNLPTPCCRALRGVTTVHLRDVVEAHSNVFSARVRPAGNHGRAGSVSARAGGRHARVACRKSANFVSCRNIARLCCHKLCAVRGRSCGRRVVTLQP